MEPLDITTAQKSIIDRAYEEYTKDLKNYTHPDDTGFRFAKRLTGDDATRQVEIDDLLSKGILEKDDSDPEPNYRITRRGMSIVAPGFDYLGKTVTATYFANKDADSELLTGTVIEASQLSPRVLIRVQGAAGETRNCWVDIANIVNGNNPFAHIFKIQQSVRESEARARRDAEEALIKEKAPMLKSALEHFHIPVPEDFHALHLEVEGVYFSLGSRYIRNEAGKITFTLKVEGNGESSDIEVVQQPTDGDWTTYIVALANAVEAIRNVAPKLSDADVEEMLVGAKEAPRSETTRYVMVNPDLLQAEHDTDDLRRDGWELQYAVPYGMTVLECWHRDIDIDDQPAPAGDDDTPDDDTKSSGFPDERYRIVDTSPPAGPMIIDSVDLGSFSMLPLTPTNSPTIEEVIRDMNLDVWQAGENAAAAVRESHHYGN